MLVKRRDDTTIFDTHSANDDTGSSFSHNVLFGRKVQRANGDGMIEGRRQEAYQKNYHTLLSNS